MEHAGVSWPECHNDPRALSALQCARYEVLGLDSIVSHNDLVTETTMIAGNEVIDIGTIDRHPAVVVYPWKDVDPYDCSIPEGALEAGRNPIVRSSFERIVERHGDMVACSRVITGPVTLAGNLWGVEYLLYLSMRDPERFSHAIGIATDLLIDICREAIGMGADSIYVPEATASCDLLVPRSLIIDVMPWYGKLSRSIRDVPSYLHICGNVEPILPHIPDSGFSAFSFEAPACTTREAYDALSGRMALVGSVETVGSLLMGSPTDVYMEALGNIRDGVNVVCSACGVPPYTTLENMRAVVNAACDANDSQSD